jgi:hypothetical protein
MAEQPVLNKDEYELVPHNQLEYLRHEVERIKRNPFGDSHSSKDLLSSMSELNKNIAKLVAIFETANDEIVRDYKDQANTEKINKVMEQNEKLAKGIVAIADLLKELKDFKAEMKPPAQPEPQMPPQDGNPFLEQQGFSGPPAGMQMGPPRRDIPGRPGPQSGNLPPIDLSDIPPPPR